MGSNVISLLVKQNVNLKCHAHEDLPLTQVLLHILSQFLSQMLQDKIWNGNPEYKAARKLE